MNVFCISNCCFVERKRSVKLLLKNMKECTWLSCKLISNDADLCEPNWSLISRVTSSCILANSCFSSVPWDVVRERQASQNSRGLRRVRKDRSFFRERSLLDSIHANPHFHVSQAVNLANFPALQNFSIFTLLFQVGDANTNLQSKWANHARFLHTMSSHVWTLTFKQRENW